jgi:hypothetical protein
MMTVTSLPAWAGPSFMGCLLTMIRPACTWRWAAIDLAGSGGGVCRSARADHPGAPLGGDRARLGPSPGRGAADDGVHKVPVQPHGDGGACMAGADDTSRR